jgi:hypothetical protein
MCSSRTPRPRQGRRRLHDPGGEQVTLRLTRQGKQAILRVLVGLDRPVTQEVGDPDSTFDEMAAHLPQFFGHRPMVPTERLSVFRESATNSEATSRRASAAYKMGHQSPRMKPEAQFVVVLLRCGTVRSNQMNSIALGRGVFRKAYHG